MKNNKLIVITDSNGNFSFSDIVNSNTKNIYFNSIDKTSVIYCRIDSANGTAKTNNNVAFSNSTLSLNYIAFDWS